MIIVMSSESLALSEVEWVETSRCKAVGISPGFLDCASLHSE